MNKKKKLHKTAFRLFIGSIICLMTFSFGSGVLREYPVLLNLINILMFIGFIVGFSGAVTILFISLFIRGKQMLKAIKSPLQKDINDRFNIKDEEQISDNSKTEEHVFCFLIKQEKKYKSIQDALEILQKDNYILQSIRTGGAFSSHDCIDSFSREYYSVDEFTKCVNNDFIEKKKNTAAEIDWSDTIFTTKNKDTGFEISFYYGEHSDSSNFCAWVTKETMAYWDDIVKKLSSLIEEKSQ